MHISTAKRFFLVICLLLAVAPLLLQQARQANADVTTTVTLSASTGDGYLYSQSTVYAAAHNAVSGSAGASSVSLSVGQSNSGSIYTIYRAYLFFDTSSIPASAVINSANLSLYVTANSSTTDFNVTLQTDSTIHPTNPLEVTDYYYGWYSGDDGSSNSSSITDVNQYWNITLDASGLSHIGLAGTTKFALLSSNDIAETAASTDEYITFSSRESGEAAAPKLTVTYTVGSTPTGTINYLIHGPYYEDGSVAPVIIPATLYQPENATLTKTFDGTGGTETLWNVTLTQPASFIAWNITASYNYTRVIYFESSKYFEEIWLFIPNAGSIIQQYSINTLILGRLSNAYTETTENVNGTNRVIERQPADAVNSLPFWLSMFAQYSLKVVADEGTFTFNLPADTISIKTFTITADMITQISDVRGFVVNATRNNATSITVYYDDPDELTLSVTTRIQRISLGQYYTDWEQTDPAFTQSFTMTNATSGINYFANITATRTDGEYSWTIALPNPAASLYWGSTFNIFGSWPIPVYQIPALVICIFIFGIGNWKDSEPMLFLAIIMCGILQIIGWGFFPTPGIIMAILIVLFMHMSKTKSSAEAVMLEG